MIDCRQARRRFLELLDPAAGQEKLLRDHLASCASCAEEAARLRAGWEALGQWEGINPSPGFERGFWERVSRLPTRRRASARRVRWLAWVPAASAAALLLLVGGWLLSYLPPGGRGADRRAGETFSLVASLEVLEHQELLAEMELLEELDLLFRFESGSETGESG